MQTTATIVGEADPVQVIQVRQDAGKVYITYIDSLGVLKGRELARGANGVTVIGTGAVNVA